jgi:hypothetical protein
MRLPLRAGCRGGEDDGYDEGTKIYKKTSVLLGAIELIPSVGRSSLCLKSSEELAYGAS